MKPQEIIAKAWATTKKEHSLRRWGFVSSLFETMRTVELLLYQVYYIYWYMQGVAVGWISVEILLFEKLQFWLFLGITIFLGIMLVMQLFIPTLATGAIIGLAAKSYRKEEVRGGNVLALYNFFPILEIHGLFILSNFAASITVFSILLRYGGEGSMKFGAMVFLGFLAIVSVLFHFFASFAEEGVVIRKLGVFPAIDRSFKLILSHMGHVVFLIILLIVISLRILINVLMILLLPIIVMGLGLLLTSFLSPAISYTITGIVAVVLLFVASYFFAYLHVFRQTVWTITYLELSEQKDLDVIVEEE